MSQFRPTKSETTVADGKSHLLIDAASPDDGRCGMLIQLQDPLALGIGQVWLDFIDRAGKPNGILLTVGDPPLMDNQPNVHQGQWYYTSDTAGLLLVWAEQVA